MKKLLILILLGGLLTACGDADVYTLYRNSMVIGGDNARIHVATFDSSSGEAYNNGNCQIAQELFQTQQGVKTKFWCEKGRFKK
jgi:hypothetical protein